MPKILITGSAGFIGSHLTEFLVKEGFQIKAFVRYNSKNSWGWLDESKYIDDIEVITGDIRDYDSVYKAMVGCDTVFHLAALIGIPYSYISPLAYIKTNIEGTYNILESAKNLNFTNVIITSTSETYGTAQYVPIDEKHPLVAQSPYSASKIAADQLALSYYRSFALPLKIVRPFNNYGPKQSARAIIPTIISQILSGKEKLKLGNLSPSRDFTFVKDTCNGFLEILKSEKLLGEITNIGMNEEISVEKLIALIAKILGKDIEFEEDVTRIRPEKSEVEKLVCDNSKIKKFTGWKPAYDLQTGLKETIEWFKDNEYRFKSEMYNV